MQRHQAVACITGARLAVPPHIAKRDAAQHDAPGPDRAEGDQQGLQNLRCRQCALFGQCYQMVGEGAQARALCAKNGRLCAHRLAQAPDQRGAAGQPFERIVRAGLKRIGELVFGECGEAVGVGAQWRMRC